MEQVDNMKNYNCLKTCYVCYKNVSTR